MFKLWFSIIFSFLVLLHFRRLDNLWEDLNEASVDIEEFDDLFSKVIPKKKLQTEKVEKKANKPTKQVSKKIL